MKKILQIAALALPMIIMAQNWGFNNDHSPWTSNNGTSDTFVVADTPTTVVLTTNGTQNPIFDNPSANVDLSTSALQDAKRYARIKLKSGANGPTYMRVAYHKLDLTAGSATYGQVVTGNTFKDITITNGDADFKTYYVDLKSTNWAPATAGTVDLTGNGKLRLIFKAVVNGSTNQNYTSTGATVEIDNFDFVPLQPLPNNTSEFTSNLEGWDLSSTSKADTNATKISVTQSNGKLVLTMPTQTTPVASEVQQTTYALDLNTNRFIHVIYTNNSANDQLRLSYKNYDGTFGAAGANVDIVPNSSGEVIFDLSTDTNLTEFMNIKLSPRKKDVAATGRISSALVTYEPGTFEIDAVLINNTNAALSSKDISKAKNLLKVYVTENTLNFRNANVSKATIYNMNGQVVKDVRVQNNAVDVSTLQAGVYIVKALSQDNTETATKFIKK